MQPDKTQLDMRFLGGCEIQRTNGSLHLESNKTRALLVYLVINPGLHQRQHLMGLLWAEFPERNARRNLRHALWNLRRALAFLEDPEPIVIDGDTVAFKPRPDIFWDVKGFELPVTRIRALQEQPDLAEMDAAVKQYRGDFLAGFDVPGAPAFDEWALVERERLRTLMLSALQWLADSYAAQGEPQLALQPARRWLALAPWQELAHRQVMRLLAASHQRQAALLQYETCRQLLAAELGVEPDPETLALYQQIKSGSIQPKLTAESMPLPASNLPLAATPFFGRETELAELANLFEQPACRLITLTGPGGIGKTRLALQAASQKVALADLQAVFVPLADLQTPAQILPAILNSLGITPIAMPEPLTQLSAYLGVHPVLLILDNFEHLMEGTALLQQILETVPQARMLVTSRQRLNLQGEWVFPLDGLEAPQAIQMFLQTARRLNLDRTFIEQESQVAEICRLVCGVPLALELAASWIRVLSCEQIIRELESQPTSDFLSAPWDDWPERHRSLQAVFERSWDLLNPDEQRIFRQLSVFRDGFQRDAAQAVTGASLATLATLVDKSLLRRRLDGRYELHGLARAFAAGKLSASGEADPVASQHAHYYSQRSQEVSAPPRKVLQWMDHEIENLRAAWCWALEQPAWDVIESIHSRLYVFFEIRSAFQEGEHLFKDALQVIAGGTDPANWHIDSQALLPWKLLSVWAALVCRQGQLERARRAFEVCLPVFRQHEAQPELAFCLFYLGDGARLQGDLPQARTYLQESLALYRQSGQLPEAAFALNVLSLVTAAQEDLDAALEGLSESLMIFQQADHPWGLAIAGINLGRLHQARQETFAATQVLQESLALCQALGHRWAAAVCLQHLGELAQLDGELDVAREQYQASYQLHDETGFWPGKRSALMHLADLLEVQGKHQRALALLLKLSSEGMGQGPLPREMTEKISAYQESLSEHACQQAAWLSRQQSIRSLLLD
ncbi:MAG: tetratricopeptide repeat protein [Anaerolineales bacterium]|nr:tetratricopeptide repeat protein [Anaerolineales bacterium]